MWIHLGQQEHVIFLHISMFLTMLRGEDPQQYKLTSQVKLYWSCEIPTPFPLFFKYVLFLTLVPKTGDYSKQFLVIHISTKLWGLKLVRPNPGSALHESRKTVNWVVCEPCGDGRDDCASPKHSVFKVSCGQPPPCLTAHLYWIFPGTWDLLQTEGHSLVMGLEAWQLCGGETSPGSILGGPLEGTVDVLCVGVRVLTHMQCWSLLW